MYTRPMNLVVWWDVQMQVHIIEIVQCLDFKLRMSPMKRRKGATTQIYLDHFFKRVDRIESSKEPVPSVSGVSEIAACPPSPIADDPSALPSPTSSLSPSQSLFVLVHLMPAPACPILLKALFCKGVLFFVSVCVKSIICLLEYSIIYTIISWIPQLTLLDSEIHLTC